MATRQCTSIDPAFCFFSFSAVAGKTKQRRITKKQFARRVTSRFSSGSGIRDGENKPRDYGTEWKFGSE